MSWVMDVHDVKGKSAVRGIAEQEEQDNTGTWEFAPLTYSRFFVLPEDEPDRPVGDMTNNEGDGLVEFKSKFDYVGSFYNDGNGLAEMLKISVPGQPAALIVYDKPGQSNYLYSKKVPNGEFHLIAAGLELLSIQARLQYIDRGFAVSFVGSPEQAVSSAKTFLRKCRLLPKRFPMISLSTGYSLPVRAFVQWTGFGPRYIENLLEDIAARHEIDEVGILDVLDDIRDRENDRPEDVYRDVPLWDEKRSRSFITQLLNHKYKIQKQEDEKEK